MKWERQLHKVFLWSLHKWHAFAPPHIIDAHAHTRMPAHTYTHTTKFFLKVRMGGDVSIRYAPDTVTSIWCLSFYSQDIPTYIHRCMILSSTKWRSGRIQGSPPNVSDQTPVISPSYTIFPGKTISVVFLSLQHLSYEMFWRTGWVLFFKEINREGGEVFENFTVRLWTVTYLLKLHNLIKSQLIDHCSKDSSCTRLTGLQHEAPREHLAAPRESVRA